MVRIGISDKALLYIFGDDKTILITGSKGSGKTNLASLIMEILIVLGYEIWTNIHFFKKENIAIAIQKNKLARKKGHIYIEKHQNIHMISSLSETLLGIINSVLGGKVFFLDEAGIHADSSVATSKNTRTIKQLNRIIRHFECAFVLLTQTPGSVPPDLRENDVDYHFKVKKTKTGYKVGIGKKKVMVDVEGKEHVIFPIKKTLNIPLSRYPCDGKFPSGFNIDIDLKEALDRLSKIEDSIEIMDKGIGRKIIEEMIVEKKEQIGYLTTGKYAKKYGISPATVRRWVEEGKMEFYTVPGRGKGDYEYRILDAPPMIDKEKILI